MPKFMNFLRRQSNNPPVPPPPTTATNDQQQQQQDGQGGGPGRIRSKDRDQSEIPQEVNLDTIEKANPSLIVGEEEDVSSSQAFDNPYFDVVGDGFLQEAVDREETATPSTEASSSEAFDLSHLLMVEMQQDSPLDVTKAMCIFANNLLLSKKNSKSTLEQQLQKKKKTKGETMDPPPLPDDIAKEVLILGGHTVLFLAMTKFVECEQLQRAGCSCILLLARHMKNTIVAANGIVCIKNALLHHPSSKLVQRSATAALSALFVGFQKAPLSVAIKLQQAILALPPKKRQRRRRSSSNKEKEQRDIDQQNNNNITNTNDNDDENKENPQPPNITTDTITDIDIGIVELIVMAMKRYPHEVDLQDIGCRFLTTLSREPKFATLLRRNHAMSAVTTALEKHPNHSAILLCCQKLTTAILA